MPAHFHVSRTAATDILFINVNLELINFLPGTSAMLRQGRERLTLLIGKEDAQVISNSSAEDRIYFIYKEKMN